MGHGWPAARLGCRFALRKRSKPQPRIQDCRIQISPDKHRMVPQDIQSPGRRSRKTHLAPVRRHIPRFAGLGQRFLSRKRTERLRHTDIRHIRIPQLWRGQPHLRKGRRQLRRRMVLWRSRNIQACMAQQGLKDECRAIRHICPCRIRRGKTATGCQPGGNPWPGQCGRYDWNHRAEHGYGSWKLYAKAHPQRRFRQHRRHIRSPRTWNTGKSQRHDCRKYNRKKSAFVELRGP